MWTDENGKQHFGDRPPAESSAKDIVVEQEKFELENVDEGYPTTDPELFKNYGAEYLERRRAEKQQKAALRQQQKQAMAGPCREARERLTMLQSRVNFTDDDGNPVQVSERERQAEAETLAREIADRCS